VRLCDGLLKGFGEIRRNFSNIQELEAADSVWGRKSGYAMRTLCNEMQPPHAITQPLVKFIPKADHNVHRINRIWAGIGPVCPVVFPVGSGQRMNLKTFRDCGFVACIRGDREHQK